MTKEDIDKACKWLERNLECTYDVDYELITKSRLYEGIGTFVKRFRKEMEE